MDIKELKKELLYTPKHVYDVILEEKEVVESLAKEYIEFLSTVKTERESVEFAKELLNNAGFKEENLEKGYFIYKNKFLAAWKKGKNPLTKGLRIVVSHIDTPRLDLKMLHFHKQGQGF